MAKAMNLGTVAYSEEITCPTCGNKFAGYYAVLSDGQGKSVCPQCHADILQALPRHYVPQIPPDDFESPARPHVRDFHYPGLYDKPKGHPRFHFMDIARVALSPNKTFVRLYLNTNMQRAMAIVAVFSIVLVAISVLVSVDMADVIGYDAGDTIQFAAHIFFSWVLTLLTFLIYSIVASAIAKGVFEGRGDRSSTIALLGYCFPIYVLVSIVLFVIFEVGFGGVGFVGGWSSEDLNRVTVGVFILSIAAFIGLVWLLIISGRAISVANDISLGEGGLASILSASAVGVIYLIVQSVMSLPLLFMF